MRALAPRHTSTTDSHGTWHNICVYTQNETWNIQIQAGINHDRSGCRRPADPTLLRPERSIDNDIQGARPSPVHWCHNLGQWVLLLPPWLLSSSASVFVSASLSVVCPSCLGGL